jgi:3-isopropylmalate/(R)-2-methylmalate dehydratase small subunit
VSEHIVTNVKGRGCVIRGDDIDTDRIIPARFLRCVTFDEVGEHAFEDDRKQAKGDHPLDDERFAGAKLLVVGENFGCGSSREHAPQSLMRFGFEAFIGASFAEIFFGNCTALGVPCVTLPHDELSALMDSVTVMPDEPLELSLEELEVRHRGVVYKVAMPEGTLDQFIDGTWHATAALLAAGDEIEATAARLPYINGFGA